jgi:hypothetical protein
MITFEDRRKIFDRVLKEVADVAVAGQKEYAHNEGNALGNFERLAQQLNTDKEKVLWTYLVKHLDGILAHINGHTSQREPVDGRIKDAICYLILLQCMVDDERKMREINAQREP